MAQWSEESAQEPACARVQQTFQLRRVLRSNLCSRIPRRDPKGKTCVNLQCCGHWQCKATSAPPSRLSPVCDTRHDGMHDMGYDMYQSWVHAPWYHVRLSLHLVSHKTQYHITQYQLILPAALGIEGGSGPSYIDLWHAGEGQSVSG